MEPSRNEAGASSVEYGLLAVAIAGLIVIIVFALGRVTAGTYKTTCDNLKGQISTTQTC
jgi:Flp pilus assembly pilin Flp